MIPIRMRFNAIKQLLRYASVGARTIVTRDIGQPTNYTHPELIAPGESKYCHITQQLCISLL